MENNDCEEEFDLMVRDFTEQGFMAKSEARRRFMEINKRTHLSAFQEGLEEALKLLPEKRDYPNGEAWELHEDVGWNDCRAMATEAITSRIEESKKGNV